MHVVPIVKTEEKEERMVYAEVYAPNRPDSHGEFMREDTIKAMAYEFVKEGRVHQIDIEHNNELVPGACVVESFIARKGDKDFIEGAWVVGIQVLNDELWQAIKSGEVNGLSLEALVMKQKQEVIIEIPPVISGKTSKSDDHEHEFFVTYDEEGNYRGGVTGMAAGHVHLIKTGTVTEAANGHTHRFSSVDGIEIVD
jgi:hypothetical protein